MASPCHSRRTTKKNKTVHRPAHKKAVKKTTPRHKAAGHARKVKSVKKITHKSTAHKNKSSACGH